MSDGVVFDYLNPDVPPGLRLLDVPLIRANRDTIKGYGEIVRDPKKQKIEIVPWPLNGSRKLDAGTGIEGGTTEGIFACEWRGNELIGRNEAVGGHYVIGFRDLPETGAARRGAGRGPRAAVALQLSPRRRPALLAARRQAVRRAGRAAGRRSRARGLHGLLVGRQRRHLHPSRHLARGRVPGDETGRFFDKQGKVHARVSCDLAREFGVLLNVPLPQG